MIVYETFESFLDSRELYEGKVFDYLRDLIKKWYRSRKDMSIVGEIMKITGIDDMSVIMDILNGSVSVLGALNQLIQYMQYMGS